MSKPNVRAFGLALVLTLAGGHAASADHFAKSRQANIALIQSNNFGVHRDLKTYGQFLTPDHRFRKFSHYDVQQPVQRALFSRYLQRYLGKDDLWIDMGAGEAHAQRDHLASGGSGHLVSIAVAKPKDAIADIAATEQRHAGRYAYLDGKFIEDYQLPALKQRLGRPAKIITDVLGPLTYSEHPDVVLDRYVQLLGKHGKLFFSVTASDVRFRDEHDQPVSIANWIASIPGLRLRRVFTAQGGWSLYRSYVVEKVADEVHIPQHLGVSKFSSSGIPCHPPLRAFKVQSKEGLRPVALEPHALEPHPIDPRDAVETNAGPYRAPSTGARVVDGLLDGFARVMSPIWKLMGIDGL